jgi:23S rRNA (guanine745-N1)-methyltransferase
LTEVLRCPHCHAGLVRTGTAYRCVSGHAFDLARQGYVNLLPGPTPHRGDSPRMLDSRAAALGAGHLEAVTSAVTACVTADLPSGVVVEVGAGTAHHLARVVEATGRRGVALEVSKYAARRAARSSPAVTAVVADAWGDWPLLDGVAAAVLHVFAPRNPAEAHRVLAPGGVLVVAVPGTDHLGELVSSLGLTGTAPAAAKLPVHPGLAEEGVTHARALRRVTRSDVHDLVAMGPNAHHITPGALAERLRHLDDALDVTIDVDVVRLRKVG